MSKRKPLPESFTPDADNVLETYWQATPDERSEGFDWYLDAHKVAGESPRGHASGAGMLAALSPQTLWDDNVAMFRAMLDGETPKAQTGVNVTKARRCLAGEHWSEVFGPGRKTRAFAALIEDPYDTHAVCIDRHAFDVAVGHVTADSERNCYLRRAGVYERFAQTYRDAAEIIGGGVTPAQVQAVSWVVWRNRKAES